MKNFQVDVFGQIDSKDVHRYSFENDRGYRLAVMTYGATIVEYSTPDRTGQFDNIILAFDKFEDYPGNDPRYGACIGPVGGRIAGASFDLEGETYSLEVNNGPNNLHSGPNGFDATLFEVESVDDRGLTLYTERPDGSAGFPGHLKVWVSYQLTEKGELEISYRIQTDQASLVNPTNHSYFNLSGDFLRTINHEIFQLDTKGYYPVTEASIPLENLDSDSSFVKQLQVGCDLETIFADNHEQLAIVGGGLDHPFVLTNPSEQAGSLYDPETGRYLTFWTDRPLVVVYTANFSDARHSVSDRTHNGIALETQVIPDAIHRQEKEQVILAAHQEFTSKTVYYASVKN